MFARAGSSPVAVPWGSPGSPDAHPCDTPQQEGQEEPEEQQEAWMADCMVLGGETESSRDRVADVFSVNATWEPCAGGGEPTCWHACVGELGVETTSRANKPRKLLLERAWRLLDHRLLLMPYAVGPLHFYGGFLLGVWNIILKHWNK